MKLPRNVKIFRGQLDAAPFASVSFLLLLFLVLQSRLVFTPGLLLRVDVPEVPADLAGTPASTVVVAVDRTGQIYFETQATTLTNLRAHLKTLVRNSTEPLTLEVQADKAATWETTAPLLSLAKEVGMREALIVTRPRLAPVVKPQRK